MNDIYSKPDLKYHVRWLTNQLRDAVKNHPVVVLSGARQVGKSTLLLHEKPFSEWRYVTLDDYDLLSQAERNPQSLWAGTKGVVIDEVQKSPRLLEAIKIAVDSGQYTYPIILSGSANLNLMKQVSESLAGRAVYFTLHPMTYGELKSFPMVNPLTSMLQSTFPNEKKVKAVSPDAVSIMWKGFMPGLMDFNDEQSILRWWEGYVLTYLERDLRQLSQIESLTDFRRLMTACALRCGNMINQTELSRDTGISQPTVHRYMNLLETTCLMYRVPAYAVNRTKRLMKSPKLMWVDPGLASFLSGFYDVSALCSSSAAGGIFESMVYLHLYVLTQLMTPKARIYYWRTSTGKEVDFVIEWGQKLIAVEVKLSDRARYGDLSGIQLFLKEYPEAVAGLLINNGNEIRQMDDNIFALPWHQLCVLK